MGHRVYNESFLKKEMKLIFAYIEILLSLFRDADWFSLCANFV